ncbi:MAG: hypothetical protein AB7T49_10155 [Oligoflexales bacterium]
MHPRTRISVVAMVIHFLAPNAFGKSSTISGHDFTACWSGAYFYDDEPRQYATGFGVGYRHYSEESKYWVGLREQWSICGGGLSAQFESESDDTRTYASPLGAYLTMDYFPFVATLLPGRRFTALFVIPEYFVGFGFTGMFMQTKKFTYVDEEAESPFIEKQPEHNDLFVGPALLLGAQYRFFAVEWGTQLRIGPSWNAATGKVAATGQIAFAVGGFGVK